MCADFTFCCRRQDKMLSIIPYYRPPNTFTRPLMSSVLLAVSALTLRLLLILDHYLSALHEPTLISFQCFPDHIKELTRLRVRQDSKLPELGNIVGPEEPCVSFRHDEEGKVRSLSFLTIWFKRVPICT